MVMQGILENELCGSKNRRIGLTKTLAKELAIRDITVNALAHGFIEN
ncbi:hypothetical protein [Cytobacillus oceanisediminis]|nr:hypothetical protein [Cytobacillus oceanisediminis]